MLDLTRNIQRKKEKELAALQFVGGETSDGQAAGRSREKGRPQRSLSVRKREEIQKMLQRTLIASVVPAAGGARRPIFPDQIGTFKKAPAKTMADAGPRACSTNSAWKPRSRPSTQSGHQAFYRDRLAFPRLDRRAGLFRSPPAPRSHARPISRKLAVTTSDGTIFAYGNYVFQFTGAIPPPADLQTGLRPVAEARTIAAARPDELLAADGPGPEFGALHPGPGLARPVRAEDRAVGRRVSPGS